MYVTRPLSQLRKSPEILTDPPSSHGPNSGFLAVEDEESDKYSCFGLSKNGMLKGMPFPQNRELLIRYTINNGQNNKISLDHLFLIPLLNHPLSSHRYYAISPLGEAFTCSKEEEKATFCYYLHRVKDVKPMPLDPKNEYQQFEIAPRQWLFASRNSFSATSVASHGFPPNFLRREGSTMQNKAARNFQLGTAQGLDPTLRARLPVFESSSPPVAVVVGKWYSPFVFVRELGTTLGEQVARSMYYEVTLEQRWEKIFARRNDDADETRVSVDVVVEKEEVFVGGRRAERDERSVVDGGVVWYTSDGGAKGEETRVGLRVEIVERMRWEQERGGWAGGDDERRVRIRKEYYCKEGEGWSEFGCYVLVERFNFTRMDGSLVMCCDFKHFDKLKTKWECS